MTFCYRANYVPVDIIPPVLVYAVLMTVNKLEICIPTSTSHVCYAINNVPSRNILYNSFSGIPTTLCARDKNNPLRHPHVTTKKSNNFARSKPR